MKRLKELISDDSAQGMLEYVLMLAVVIAIGVMFKPKLIAWFNGLTDKVDGEMGNL